MTNPHAVRLEKERRELWARKRANRKFIENAHWLVPNFIDRGHRVRQALTDLVWLELELERVCHQLGRDPHPPTVRLDAPAARRKQPVVKLDAPVRRTSALGYVTRDMGLGR